MKDALVTVVVPIYNVERYLNRCIESIVNQTYTNLEIILVDDGSPDNCPMMCNEWTCKDERIKVVHKENAGLGMARNTGIEHATGEYICFFDSDDYVELTTIEECCKMAQKEEADIVCFGHDKVTQDGKVVERRFPTPPKNVFVGDEVREQLMPMTLSHNARTGENWNLSLSAWCEMFSMKTINESGWRFVSERDIISEDIYSVLQFYQYAKKVVFINKIFYHYTTNLNSLSQSYRADRYEKIKHLAFKLEELSNDMNCTTILQERVAIIFCGLTIGALKQIVSSKNTMHLKCQELRRIMNDEYIQNVLATNNFLGEGLPKRTLYWAIKNKLVLFCYFIIAIKNMDE